jgi:hypothetical protein
LRLLHELEREVANLVVHHFYPFRIERAGILDLLLADLPQRGISVAFSLSIAQLCTILRRPTTFNSSCG